MSAIQLADLLVKLKVLGVSVPSNPAGAMTAEEIITALDASIGDFWKQGVSGAIMVNDLTADSADLAPYLNGDGKWHIPSGTVLFINTRYLSDESKIGRNIYALGSILILSPIGSERGIYFHNGSENFATHAIENVNGSTYITGAYLVSDSPLGFFSATNSPATFWIKDAPCLMTKAGTIDNRYVFIHNDLWGLSQENCIIGGSCQVLSIKGSLYNPYGFFGASYGFDCTSTPSYGDRNIVVSGVYGAPVTEPIITIDHNGDGNTGYFSNFDGAQNPARIIAAASDAPFTANPLLSENFVFDVANFGTTCRFGELYFNGNTTIAISASGTWTDLYTAAIAEGDLSNGFHMTANAGELEYTGVNPVMVRVSTGFQGYASSGAPEFIVGAFYKPAAGAYAQVTKAGFPVEQDSRTTGSGSVSSDYVYNILMNQGDKIKTMVKNVTNSLGVELHNYQLIATALT